MHDAPFLRSSNALPSYTSVALSFHVSLFPTLRLTVLRFILGFVLVSFYFSTALFHGHSFNLLFHLYAPRCFGSPSATSRHPYVHLLQPPFFFRSSSNISLRSPVSFPIVISSLYVPVSPIFHPSILSSLCFFVSSSLHLIS